MSGSLLIENTLRFSRRQCQRLMFATAVAVGVHGGDSLGASASPGECFGTTKCRGVMAGRDFAEPFFVNLL